MLALRRVASVGGRGRTWISSSAAAGVRAGRPYHEANDEFYAAEVGERTILQLKNPKRAVAVEKYKWEYAYNHVPKKMHHIRPFHPIETQLKYMKSQTFKDTYKGYPIYKWYKRNISGGTDSMNQPVPRLFCIDRDGRFKVNNPCSICRDEYLWFDYRNMELLKMFMVPNTIRRKRQLSVGLCREQYMKLKVEIVRAINVGYLENNVPFRNYDYGEYYDWWTEPPPEPVPPHLEHFAPVVMQHKRIYDTHNLEKAVYEPWWQRWDKFVKKVPHG